MKKMKKLIADCTADREKPIASFRRESGPPWQNVLPRSGREERESEQIMNLASFQLAIVSEGRELLHFHPLLISAAAASHFLFLPRGKKFHSVSQR